jgi:hypothetical protein
LQAGGHLPLGENAFFQIKFLAKGKELVEEVRGFEP